MMRGHCRTRGFTLIEVIVTMVLTSILIISVLGVLRAVLRTKPSAPSMASSTAAELLRRDLSNATYYRESPSTLELAGALAEDENGGVIWDFARVKYAVQSIPGDQGVRGLLSREIRASKVRREPVWLGISSITLQTTFLDDTQAGVPENLKSEGWKNLPPSFQVLVLGERGRVWHSESIYR